MQICNKAPYPANDGSSIAIYNMAKGLLQNEVDLYLLTINTKKHFKPDAEVPEAFKTASHYTSVFRNTNTSVGGAFLNLFSSHSYFQTRFHFKAFEEQLIQLLKAHRFDVIQLEGLFMGSYIPLIKRHSAAKLVLRAHNIEHYIWNRHIANEKNSFRRAYLNLQNNRLKQFELTVLKQVDAVVTITATDAHELRRLGCDKPVFTCITGVDIKEYQTPLNLPQKAKTLFYFGSMDWLPNQEAVTWFLENCWETVHKAVPEARLIIAGRGMPLEFFHINKPNVLIVENVENGSAFYRQHQVMIVPLWSGSGLRIKIIEGMSYGKSIVSTSIGAEGIPYTSGKNILIADSATEFSKQVIAVLTDQKLRENLESGAAHLAAQEFDNHKVVSALMQFYKHICHG